MFPSPALVSLLALTSPVVEPAPANVSLVRPTDFALAAAPTWAPPAYQMEHFGDRRKDGPYFQIGFGLATTSNSSGPGEEIDFDEGYAVPFAFGRRYSADNDSGPAFDVELEGYWSDQDTDDPTGPINAVSDITILGLLLNGLVDAPLSDSVSFYGGGGIGLSFLDVGTQSDAVNDFDDEDGPFLTWQLKAGFRWYVTEVSSWSLGYRFVNIDDAEIDDSIGNADFALQTEQHVLELGFRTSL